MTNAKPSQTLTLSRSQAIIIGLFLIGLVVLIGVMIVARSENSTVTAKISPIQYDQQFQRTPTDHLLLDVRTPEEFATGHIQGAVNISLQTLSTRLNELPRDKPIVIYCRSGNRSQQASKLLTQAGYSQLYDLGGIIEWSAANYPVIQ